MTSECYVVLHRPDAPILVYIPFTGADRKCWSCGRNREVLLRLDVNGNLKDWKEVCAN